MSARWIVTLKNAPPLAVTATAVAKTDDDDFLQFSDGDGGRSIVALVSVREIVSVVCQDEEPAKSDDALGMFTLQNGAVLRFHPLPTRPGQAIFDVRGSTSESVSSNITKEQARRISAALHRWATS